MFGLLPLPIAFRDPGEAAINLRVADEWWRFP